MTNRSVCVLFVGAMLILSAPAISQVEEPSRESLLAAWEAGLRGDPQPLV